MTNELKYLILLLFPFLFGCNSQSDNNEIRTTIDTLTKDDFNTVVYTQKSTLKNTYEGFHSPKAINRIAEIENEYFNNYKKSSSQFYGTMWREDAECIQDENDTLTLFQKYWNEQNSMGNKPDSMHCTIYAIEALKAGLGASFSKIRESHKQIWKEREFAGWSIAHILTKQFNWKAYLIISEIDNDYKKYLRDFKKRKLYDVWRQPDIPIVKVFDFDNEKDKIDSLLLMNEFGWGFSDKGWHTWITRFDTLKECNWIGTPSLKYDEFGTELFLKTKFTEYYDYSSHVIVFPPKKGKQ